MNLARAFAELDAGAELYCLHKNPWWQTSRGPLLDSGAFVAGLEYAAGVEATVLGKPSPTYFVAALEALDADPERTWMIGDDIEADIRGAQLHGMRTALVRTGKFRPDAVERSGIMPDAILSSIADLPDWLDRTRREGRGRPDRDRADPARARALPRLPRALLHRGRDARTATRARTPPRATRAGSPARRRSARRSASACRFTWKEIEIVGRPKPARLALGRARARRGSGSGAARSTSR